MASPTKKTDLIRKRKQSSAGQSRKRKNREQGTTRSEAELFGDK